MKEFEQSSVDGREPEALGFDPDDTGSGKSTGDIPAGSDSVGKKKKTSSKTKANSFKPKKKSKDLKEVNLDEYNFAGFKYKIPGKRQRVIVASLVLGLNLILSLAVILYFKSPGFKELIYSVGR